MRFLEGEVRKAKQINKKLHHLIWLMKSSECGNWQILAPLGLMTLLPKSVCTVLNCSGVPEAAQLSAVSKEVPTHDLQKT